MTSRVASRNPSWARCAIALVGRSLLGVALLVSCGSCGNGEEPATATTEPAAAEPTVETPAPSTPAGPSAPTSAEIEALAARAGVAAPVARALLLATATGGLEPAARQERLSALAADFHALTGELRAEAAAGATGGRPDAVAEALAGGDLAAGRSAAAAAVARLAVDSSPDAARETRLAALRVREGRIALLQGLDAEAAALFEQALVPGLDGPVRAGYEGFLGVAQLRAGELEAARTSLTEAVSIARAYRGNDHPEVAAAFEPLADCYRALDEYAKAETLYQRALGIWQRQADARPMEISRLQLRLQELRRLQDEEADDPGKGHT